MAEPSLPVAFTAGLSAFFAPPTLVLLVAYYPSVTAYSAKFLLNRALAQPITSGHGPKHFILELLRQTGVVVLNSLLFILGFLATFIAVATTGIGMHAIRVLTVVGSLLIIFLGISAMGVFQSHLANKFVSKFAVVLIGVAVTVGWTPVVGPILGSILQLAFTQGQLVTGVGLLISYAFGLSIFFIFNRWLIALIVFFTLCYVVLYTFPPLSRLIRRVVQVVSFGAALVLVLYGALMLSGYLTVLNMHAISQTPQSLLGQL